MSSALAVSGGENEEHHLVFIDQKHTGENLYHQAVLNWHDSPFRSVKLFKANYANSRDKLRSRKKIFQYLEKMVLEKCPDEIRVGNDRRIEFQFFMQAARKCNPQVCGAYMDEGFYTYMGREASGSFSDRFIDGLAKKISYGFWWTTPSTIGASHWIKKAYLAFPELAHPDIQKKQLIAINKKAFVSDELKSLSYGLLKNVGLKGAELAETDFFVALPHESVYQQDGHYKDKIILIVDYLIKTGKKVAVKYHPRDRYSDALCLGGIDGITLVPNKANFEALLFLLPPCRIIGDFSSVLLTAKWLRDDLSVLAINTRGGNDELNRFYQKLGIATVSLDQLNTEFMETL